MSRGDAPLGAGVEHAERVRAFRAAQRRRFRAARWAVPAAVLIAYASWPASALAGAPGPSSSSSEVRGTRLILIISLVVFVVLLVIFRTMLVGVDKRLSTSKTIAAAWTALVAGSLFALVVAKFADYPQALENMMHSGLAGQYGLLIGGPLGAAIAAKAIVSSQVSKNSAAKSSGTGPNVAQLVQNDAEETDLGDFQYVLFNFVAMVFFVGTLIESPTSGFPHIPDILLGLTSVAAAGYVTKKALPSEAPTAALDSAKGAELSRVVIKGSGLLIGEPPKETPLIVLFGSREARLIDKERAGTTDSIEVEVPQGLPQGKPVQVVVVTPAPARVNAGPFTRE
jgi:hypothetical protein